MADDFTKKLRGLEGLQRELSEISNQISEQNTRLDQQSKDMKSKVKEAAEVINDALDFDEITRVVEADFKAFKRQIDSIKDDFLRQFTKDYLDKFAPDYFYQIPASSTGKYHPDYTHGNQGLIRHTKTAVNVADILARDMNLSQLDKDTVKSALLIHDTWKAGTKPDAGRHTVDEHPALVRAAIPKDYLASLTGEQTKKLEQVLRAVESHMGEYRGEASNVLPLPETTIDRLVHTADAISADPQVIAKGVYGVAAERGISRDKGLETKQLSEVEPSEVKKIVQEQVKQTTEKVVFEALSKSSGQIERSYGTVESVSTLLDRLDSEIPGSNKHEQILDNLAKDIDIVKTIPGIADDFIKDLEKRGVKGARRKDPNFDDAIGLMEEASGLGLRFKQGNKRGRGRIPRNVEELLGSLDKVDSTLMGLDSNDKTKLSAAKNAQRKIQNLAANLDFPLLAQVLKEAGASKEEIISIADKLKVLGEKAKVDFNFLASPSGRATVNSVKKMESQRVVGGSIPSQFFKSMIGKDPLVDLPAGDTLHDSALFHSRQLGLKTLGVRATEEELEQFFDRAAKAVKQIAHSTDKGADELRRELAKGYHNLGEIDKIYKALDSSKKTKGIEVTKHEGFEELKKQMDLMIKNDPELTQVKSEAARLRKEAKKQRIKEELAEYNPAPGERSQLKDALEQHYDTVERARLSAKAQQQVELDYAGQINAARLDSERKRLAEETVISRLSEEEKGKIAKEIRASYRRESKTQAEAIERAMNAELIRMDRLTQQKITDMKMEGEEKVALLKKQNALEQIKLEKQQISLAKQREAAVKKEIGGSIVGGFGGGGQNKFRSNLSNAVDWTIGYGLVGMGSGLLYDTYETIKDYELALVNIKKVYDEMNPAQKLADMREMGEGIRDLAITYGETVENIGRISEEWVKVGARSVDELKELTKVSILAKNTSDLTRDNADSTENAAKAVTYLNSAIQQLGLGFEDAERVLDVWNKIADDFPGDTRDFAEAFQRSASFASNLGLELEELTAAVAILLKKTGRDGREVGNALQTIFSNLTRPKALNVLDKYGIKVKSSLESFNDFADVMGHLSERYTEFGEAQANAFQIELADALGQTRRKNFVMSLLSGWEEFEDIVTKAMDATGYSMQKNEIMMTSLEKKLMQLRAAWQDLSIAFGETGLLDMIKGAADGTREFITVLNELDPTLRASLNTWILMGGALLGTNKLVKVLAGSSLLELIFNLGSAKKQTEAFNKAMSFLNKEKAAGKVLDAEYIAIRDLLAKKYNQAAVSTKAQATSVKAAAVAQSALNKSMFLARGLMVAGIPLAIGLIGTVVQYNRQAKERLEADQKNLVQDNQKLNQAESLLEAQERLIETEQKLTEERDRAFRNAADYKSIQSELDTVQKELIKNQKELASVMPETTTRYNEQGEAIAEATEANRQFIESERERIRILRMLKYEDAKQNIDKAEKKVKDLEAKLAEFMRLAELASKDEPGINEASVPFTFGPARKYWLTRAKGVADELKEAKVELEDMRNILNGLNLEEQEFVDKAESAAGAIARQASETQSAARGALETSKLERENIDRANELLEQMASLPSGGPKWKQAVKDLRALYPELEDLGDITVEKVHEVIRARESSNEEYLRTSKDLLSDELSLLEARLSRLQLESSILSAIKSGVDVETKLNRTPSAGNFRLIQMMMDSPEAYEESVNVQREAVEAAIKESQELLNEMQDELNQIWPGISGGGGSSGSGNKYEYLDNALKKYESRIVDVTNKIKLLDLWWKDSGYSAEYAARKQSLMSDQMKITREELAYVNTQISKLSSNMSANGDKVAELKEKQASLNIELEELKQSAEDIARLKFEDTLKKIDKSMGDLADRAKRLNTYLGELADRPENLSLKIKNMQEQMEIAMSKMESYYEELKRQNALLAESEKELAKAKQMTGEAGKDAVLKAQGLVAKHTQMVQETKRSILALKTEYQGLRQDLLSMISEAIQLGRETVKEDEIGRIQELIEGEEERFDEWRKNKEKELEILEERWAKEDREEEKRNRHREMRELRKRYELLEPDDSQWAAKQRKELKEKMEELQKEIDEAAKEAERDKKRKEIEEEIERAEEASEEKIKTLEEEIEDTEDLYEELLKEARLHSDALVAIHKGSWQEILAHLQTIAPDFFKASEKIAMEIKDGLGITLASVVASPDLIEAYNMNKELWNMAKAEGDKGLMAYLEQQNSELRNRLGIPYDTGPITFTPVEESRETKKWEKIGYEPTQPRVEPPPGWDKSSTGGRHKILGGVDYGVAQDGQVWKNNTYKVPRANYQYLPEEVLRVVSDRELGYYKYGGRVPEDELAFVHKREMILPEKLADVIESLPSILVPAYDSIPIAGMKGLEGAKQVDNSVNIDTVTKIEHAHFNDEVDVEAFSIAQAEMLKRQWRRRGAVR